jgi:hypothetical protein
MKTTPDDLAVAFRSLIRRRHEAIDAAEGAPVGGLVAELDGHVKAAADLLDVAPDAAAVATAIASRPADGWDTATLDALRQHALDAAAVLRRISAYAPPDDQ